MKSRLQLIIIFFLATGPAGAKGRQPPNIPPPRFHAWITYFRGTEGFADWELVGHALDEVSVFALQFDEQGRLIPADPWVREVLAHLRESSHPPKRLWLTVVNDRGNNNRAIQKDPKIVHEKVADEEARKHHIDDLLPWARTVDGLDIDYENLRAEDGESYSLFVEELAGKLHAQGKRLSVTVEPKTDLSPGDRGRAIEWKRIGAVADQVRVMAYFYHYPTGDPGSIAPLDWLSTLARFAQGQIPSDKLSLVLTVNGLDWPLPGMAHEIRFSEAASLLADPNVKRQRDSDQTPYFRYRKNEKMHEVWYEDSSSLTAKVDVLHRAGVRSIGFWHLGTGDPTLWGCLQPLKTKFMR